MTRVVNLLKKLNWHAQEDHSTRWRDWHEAVGEKQGVDYRDEVRHSGKTRSSFNSVAWPGGVMVGIDFYFS